MMRIKWFGCCRLFCLLMRLWRLLGGCVGVFLSCRICLVMIFVM